MEERKGAPIWANVILGIVLLIFFVFLAQKGFLMK